jgi:hypothetical protein
MAKRPTINTLTNTASPTYLTQLNQNFSNIQAQFDNTLSLDGSLPNAMNADLDLNDFDLINAGTVNADNLVVAGTNLNSVVAQAATSATNAATSASAAAASAATASQYTPAYFTDVAELLADTRSWPTGQILNTREEGFAYEVVTSGQHVTTAGGVKLVVLPGATGYNVLAFGPAGAASVQSAINAAQARGGVRGTIDVWVPEGVYALGSTTITVPIGVGFRCAGGAQFTYTGTGVALDIYGNGQTGARYLDLPNLEKPGVGTQPQWDAGLDTSSIGVRLNALHFEQVRMRSVRGFNWGLELKALESGGGNSQNCIVNTIYLSQLVNNRRGIVFTWNSGPTVAGVNQNTFIGGTIRIDSAWNNVANRYGLFMPDQENNGNTFIGTNLEDFSGAADTEYAIYCNSTNNVFMNIRLENGGTDSVEFGSTGSNNTLICSLDAATVTGPFEPMMNDNGFANKYITNNIIGSKFFTLDFNSGRILFGNGTAAPVNRLQGFGTNRLQIGQATTFGGTRYFGSMLQEVVEVTSGASFAFTAQHYNLNYAAPASITLVSSTPTDLSGIVTFHCVGSNITLPHTATPTGGRFNNTSGASVVLTAGRTATYRLYAGNFYQI